MPSPARDEDVTRLLKRVSRGDPGALERVFPILYEELQRLASSQLRREEPGHTLQTTALVHEAFLRLAGSNPEAADRRHFVSIAARAMRQVLVDHARRRRSGKRGGEWIRTTLGEGRAGIELDLDGIIDLDRALDSLEERQRRVVEMRYFAGLEEREVADLLGITERTVRRDWVKARAWLYAELYPEGSDESIGEDGAVAVGDEAEAQDEPSARDG